MNVSYIYINIAAFLCFALMFVAFFAAERSREMRAWLVLLGDLVLWTGGTVFMRLNVFPSYEFWYYVSLLALFSIAFLVYNYVYQFANVKNSLERIIWFVGTLIILAVSATGFFLAPPELSVSGSGMTVYTYSMDWKIAIPTVFFMFIVGSIIRLFRRIVAAKGRKAPGVSELIIGCFLMAFGNIVQILPGNTFPWDTLFGLAFAVMFIRSLYKRRMFNITPVISSSILMLVSTVICVGVAALFFQKIDTLFEKIGGHLGDPDVEAFLFLAIVLFGLIAGFRRLLMSIFSDEEQQGSRIKKYSDSVSKTLDIDSILRQTVKVIKNDIHVDQMYICLLQNGRYVPVCSAMPLKPASFTIAADHPCVKYFEEDSSGGNHIIIKEFEADPLYKSMWGSEKELFSDYGISCICALKDGTSVVGLLLLAEKEKGVDYTYADFSFLSTVCAIASIAVKNAALYKQVAEREHLFSSMTAFIPNVILIKPKGESMYCFVSANTEKVLGLPQSYFAERSAIQTLRENVDAATADEVVDALISSDGSGGCTVDIPFRTGDGRDITLRCAFSPIVTGGVKSHYVCVATDITQDIEAQLLLRNSVELAQDSSRAKGEFLSHMSHEIRTPMNSIAGLTYLAREMVGEGRDDELRDHLNQIDQSSQYLLSLLNNIMDMSKIESSRYEINTKPFDISAVLDEVYSVYSAMMSTKGVKFVIDTEGLSCPNVLGDELSLRKILNNLLSNANKFTKTGGSVKLLATQKPMNEKSSILHLEVSDTGVGISSDFIGHLFEPYTQEQNVSGGRAAGSGLGMAICKSMIDLQGGTISVKSRQGFGTTFFVDIPYSLGEAAAGETRSIDYSAINGRRIMVVDDVMINTTITCRLLERHGALVDCAENGREAVELFRSKPDYYYDCILMDIQMPEMNGIEATACIRASATRCAGTVPVLAMTADAFINEQGGALSDFSGYILKPVKPDELYAKLVGIFEKR